MTKIVIKTDGSKVPFDVKKINRSITRSASDANLSPEEINTLVKNIGGIVVSLIEPEEKVKSSEIREKILNELDQEAPRVAAEWRKFDVNRK